MTSAISHSFKLVDRGYRSTMVLIPGWASDYRIYDKLNLNFNYMIPVKFSPSNFEQQLLSAIVEYGLNKISLFGWSMGGFLACDFCSKNSSLIDELILVSIRKKYIHEELNEIKNLLIESKKGYLYKFYSLCVHEDESRINFKRDYIKKYCDQMNLDELIIGLEYLSKAEIKTESLQEIDKIKIIHGEFDLIAPLKEALQIKDDLPRAELIIVKQAGHIPFIEDDFSKYIK